MATEFTEPTVFISCGQRTAEEKDLGQAIVAEVDRLPGVTPYFAEAVSSVDGLTNHIFRALDRAVGFVCVLHRQGEVDLPSGRITRASVWIEQEIAIAAFLHHVQIPAQTCHSFRWKVATYSGRNLPLIPAQSCRFSGRFRNA